MKLQTLVVRPEASFQLDYDSRAMFLGSCFSENMASKLTDFKFETTANPFGTIYQPEALFKLLSYALGLKEISFADISYRTPFVFHNDMHSDVFAESLSELQSIVLSKLQDFKKKLDETDVLFLTFGSSFSYRNKETDSLVANCHKKEMKLFNKEFREHSEIFDVIKPCLDMLKDKHIVITISPIRHIRDGLLDNQLSKSNLRLLCNSLETKYENISYYPSYEIFMDELRDYRFYAADMIHPNGIAIDYIWEYFVDDFIDESTIIQMKQWEKIKKSLDHRPMKKNDPAYLNHLESLIEKMDKLKFLDLSKEIEDVKELISSLD